MLENMKGPGIFTEKLKNHDDKNNQADYKINKFTFYDERI